jgi:hypothetical protein
MKIAINLETRLITKIRIYIVFLEGFYWVKMRLISRYNINHILSELSSSLSALISASHALYLSKY